MDEGHTATGTLSRNPIRGLSILTSAPSFRASVEGVADPGTLQIAGLVLAIIEDLAFEADRLASQFRQTVPSLASAAYDEYIKPPESLGNQSAVPVPNLQRVLGDGRVQNLSSLLDVQAEPTPIVRSEYLRIKKQLTDLVEHLRDESPAEHRTMARILAVELQNGPIATIALGEEHDHCFLTASVATTTTGRLTSHALRWQAYGARELAIKTFAVAVAVTSFIFPAAGVAGLMLAGNDLRLAISEQLGEEE